MTQKAIDDFKKALGEKDFFQYLIQQYQSGELSEFLPEFVQLLNTPELDENNEKTSVGLKTIKLLKIADNLDEKSKYAILLHDIGKIKTSPDLLPRHSLIHGQRAALIIKQISERLNMSQTDTDFAIVVSDIASKAPFLKNMDNVSLFELYNRIPVQNFEQLLQCCQSCTYDLHAANKRPKTKQQASIEKGYARLREMHRNILSDHRDIWKDVMQKRKNGPDKIS